MTTTTTAINTRLDVRKITARIDIPAGIDGRPSYSVKGDASHYTPVAGAQADA
jgi:taurine dioxygenase